MLQVADETGTPLPEIMKEASSIVDEMAHNLRTGVIRGFAMFLVKVMKQLFQRIYVNEEQVQKVLWFAKEFKISYIALSGDENYL